MLKYSILFLMLFAGSNLLAQSHDTYKTDQNVAIDGFDVVSYFSDNQAERGSKTFSVLHNGATYYFGNADHKAAFQKSPDKYLPQYGGYCAFAMSAKNAKVASNPGTFKLYNGKLYLFFNDYYDGTPFNTIIPWNSNEANMKKNADKNWSAMK